MCALTPRVFIVTLALLLCFVSPNMATEIVTLEEVVVTATRSDRTILDVPAAVSTVNEERLNDLPLLGIKESLGGLPGVQSETRNGGYDARLIIRGAGLKARYGVREIMVLLDGVPITDPDGMTRLDFVDTQLIKQIDVVRGPNSTLYGANATGGVINVITRDPFDEKKTVTTGFGNDNTQVYSFLYGTSFGDNFFSVNGTHKETDNWREWNEFSSTQGSLKAGRLLANGGVLSGMVSYTEADIQLPGGLTKEEYDEDPSQLSSEPFRHKGRYSEIVSSNLRLEKELGRWTFKPLVYLQDWEHFHPVTGTINDGGATVAGTDLQADYRHSVFGRGAELTAGFSGQIDDGDNTKYTYRDYARTSSGALDYTLSDACGDLAEQSDEQVTKWGLFLQESLHPQESWTIDLGLRYDHVKFDLDTTVFQEFIWGADRYKVYETPQVILTNRSFDHLSPRFGTTWKLSDQFSLYGNISTGVQTPQASELNDNDELDPALTINYEIGFKMRHKAGHRLDLTLFYQKVEDEIVQTILEESQTSYSNAGQTSKFGLELAGETVLPAGWKTGISYTYSDFTYDRFTEPVYQYNPALGATELLLLDRSGSRLPYIPRHQFSWFLAYQHPKGFKARFETASWGEYWVDNANSEKYEGYDQICRLQLGWESGPWDLAIDVSNLFDEKYAMEVTKSGDDLRFRLGAPRSIFAKLSYSF